MVGRLFIALALGAIMGFEREIIHKDAGVKTSMLVAGGSCLFTLVALSLPILIVGNLQDANAIMLNSGALFNIIANIIVGIGFIGGGIIIKNREHVQGLTTAALIWSTAAIGILAGIGLWQLAAISAVIIALSIYLLRASGLSNHANRHDMPGTPDPNTAKY
jgi:putative Mg2+ transporter-C (MgtC) family protein